MTKRENFRFRVTGYSRDYAACYDPVAEAYYVSYYSPEQEREVRLEFFPSEVDRKLAENVWEKANDIA